MSSPKLRRMLHLLCAIHQQPRGAPELAKAVGCSMPTVKLSIYTLRDLGCVIRREGGGPQSRYVLEGWGVFDPDEVMRRFGRE